MQTHVFRDSFVEKGRSCKKYVVSEILEVLQKLRGILPATTRKGIFWMFSKRTAFCSTGGTIIKRRR